MSEQQKRTGPVFEQAVITVPYAFIDGTPEIMWTPWGIRLLTVAYVKHERTVDFVEELTGKIVPAAWLDGQGEIAQMEEWLCIRTNTGPSDNLMGMQFVRIYCEIAPRLDKPEGD